MTVSVASLCAGWAEALSATGEVELLLQLCTRSPTDADGGSASPNYTVRDAVSNILPLIRFLTKAGGQRVDVVLPVVAKQLPQLTHRWTEPVADPEGLELQLAELFSGVRRLLHNPDLKLSWRQYLSAAVGDLLVQLVRAVLPSPPSPDTQPASPAPAPTPTPTSAPHAAQPASPEPPRPLPPACPAQVMLRALTRSTAFAQGGGAPVLPEDATVILSWLVDTVLPPGGKAASPGPVAPAHGSRAALGLAAAQDEKLLLLVAQLTRTMLLQPSGAPAAVAQQDAADASTHGAGAAGQDGGSGGGGDAGSSNGPSLLLQQVRGTQRSLLTTLLTWSTGLLRLVLSKLLDKPTVTGLDTINSMLQSTARPATAAAAPPQPSAGVTRAAARLAASAMNGLLLQPRKASGNVAGAAAAAGVATVGGGGGVDPSLLPVGVRGQLMEVISMLLDMSEACVSGALEAGAAAMSSDKMLDTAAYILEDCSPLIITAARFAASAAPVPARPVPSFPSPSTSLDVGTVFSRLKAILLAAASLVGPDPATTPNAPQPSAAAAAASAAANGDGSSAWRRFWAWDITRPLTASSAAVTRGSHGWGAQRLCCNVAEVLACGLAASWLADVRVYTQALLLLPLSLPPPSRGPSRQGTGDSGRAGGDPSAGGGGGSNTVNEAVVLSLAMGRLFVLLRGDEELATSMLPLLTDVLGQGQQSAGAAGAGAGAEAHAGMAVVQACVVQVMAVMAAASVLAERSTTWAYNQVSDVLLRLLLETPTAAPGSPAASLAAGAKGPGAGALAAAVLALAKGIRPAKSSVRMDLRNRLLVHFGEMGLRAGAAARSGGHASPAASSPSSVALELGSLLPAIAEAGEGLEGAFSRSLSHFSFAELPRGPSGRLQQDAHMVKLLRNLWLYCALYGLAGKGASAEQAAAAGRIACWTPVLLLGEAAGSSDADVAERLKAELGERLRLAGESAASPARLRSTLQSCLGVPLGGTPQPPPDANRQAYLLTVATAELARARHAPLQLDVESSPIAVPLAYLQSTDPSSADAPWYALIAERACEAYLNRLRVAAAAAAEAATSYGPDLLLPKPPTGLAVAPEGTSIPGLVASGSIRLGGGVAGGSAQGPFSTAAGVSWAQDVMVLGPSGDEDEGDGERGSGEGTEGSSAGVERCIEGLAVSLIRHLAAAGGHAEGAAPQAVTVADRLLRQLLRAYPPVYWSHACVGALLGELELEEGLDHPLSELHGVNNLSMGSSSSAYAMGAAAAAPGGGAGGGNVWRWLHTWVAAAAAAAPTRTEALLHQFIGQSSVASYTLAGVAGGTTGGLAGGSHGQAVQRTQRAHVAALRRAADLLAICAEARRKAGGGAGGMAADGTMALCRKLFYMGAIAGVQHTAGGPSAGSAAVAETVLAALEEAVAGPHGHGQPYGGGVRLLEQRFLAAAAFLARESAEEAEEAASGACHRLLQALCTAPLKRFTPDMMGLAVFAWTWVTTAGPGWLVPLASRTAAAWSAAADRRMGLFSGPWATHSRAHAHVQAASGGEQNGVTVKQAAASEDDSAGAGAGGEANGSASAGGDVGEGEGAGAGVSAKEAELLAGLACHHQWVGFLYELWGTAGDRTDREQRMLAAVYDRLLHHALSKPERLSSHPSAAAPLFRLLQLALAYCQHCMRLRAPGAPCPPSHALLHERVLRAGLLWFAHTPGYSARMSQRQAEEQHAAVADFARLLAAVEVWPGAEAKPAYDKALYGPSAVEQTAWVSRPAVSIAVWGSHAAGLRTRDAVALLLALCRAEVERLRVWARPLVAPGAGPAAAGAVLALKEADVRTAWLVSPTLAVAICARCPPPAATGSGSAAGPGPHRELERLLAAAAHDPRVQALPEAAMVLATPDAARANAPHLAALATWAPAGAVEGLQLMAGAAQLHAGVKAYAIRCLHATPPAKVAFFLPQLVQALRRDRDGAMADFLAATAAADDLFCHQLLWALQTEERPPDSAFNPEVKRSGWQPPADSGLWDVAGRVRQRVLGALSPPSAQYWAAEDGYFDSVTSISGILKKLEPDERRAKIRSELQHFAPSRTDLYVPTNPECRVVAHIPKSGTPMQSAAKVPILVAFKVEEAQPAPLPPLRRSLACIFKVGDDVRQDVLALQVISILRDAFQTAGLELYLRPYGCIPTGYERGVIEVVPHTKSRAALGELSDRGLHDIFVAQFGAPGSPAFEAARRNFITSEAGYAIASFLLQAKDRHNGNLLIDSSGHLVHIDFGFILEISPGGNMGFESAAFKLSHEMTQLLDPGGMRNSGHFRLFEELCVRGYLAARTVAEPIIATVALMAESGLPCFGHGKPLPNLRKRFHLEMTELQAAAFMRATIADAYQKWTTGFYDYIQALQNRIPY